MVNKIWQGRKPRRPRRNNPFRDYEESMVALGTSHVTKSDADRLNLAAELHEKAPTPLIVYPHHDYGWMINTTSSLLELEPLDREGFSTALIQLLEAVHKAGHSWLLLDRDAPVHPDFPTFKW